ncbi:restriction endonuclease subunit S [Macrococcoides bohemicum]|uniref:restriction endonuclease subunit S n=1 Tax=Macrococcoides bohemicum TaxID=1903056 RepID=UPI003AFFB9D1
MSRVPEIRFKGFTDGWEQRKLGEVVKIKDSARVPNVKWQTEGIPYLRSSDLNCDDKKDRLYLSLEDYLIYKSKTGAPEKGDMLFASGGEIGLAIYVENDSPIYVQGGSILYTKTSKSKDLDGLYLKYSFESPSIKSFIKRASTGTSLKHFVLKQASSLPICFPDISEQISISKLFENIDNTITLHQRKLEQLQQTKTAFLQKLFPKMGEHVPEVRFPEYNGKWESWKIKDIFSDIRSGNRLPKDKLTVGDIPYVIAQINNNGIYTRISADTKDFNGNKMKLFEAPSITFSIDNPKAIFLQVEPYFTSNIMRTLFHPSFNLYHYTFFLENLKKLVTYFDWSIKFSGPVVMNSYIMVPIIDNKIDLNEINAIGKFINNLDKEIMLVQKELNFLKQMKQGFLQKMFPKGE